MNQHQQNRQQLWINVAITIAGHDRVSAKEVPIAWANAALEAFDKTFPEPPERATNPLTPEDLLDLQRIALERAEQQDRERKDGSAPTCQTCRYFEEARSVCHNPQHQFRSQTTRPTWSCPAHEAVKPADQ